MQGSVEFRPNQRVLDPFISWIEQPCFPPIHAKQWAQRFHNDPEGAMCEASFWAIMQDCDVDVEPNPNVTPDFVCRKNGNKFYVEVTCIQIETATRMTNLPPHRTQRGASFIGTLNRAIKNECSNKAGKCANLDAPCLIAVGTFHPLASAIVIRKPYMEDLHTDPCIGMDFDPQLCRMVGEAYQLASRKKSVFTKPSIDGVAMVRQSISGLLVAGFGCDPPRICGLLNNAPVHYFDSQLLRRIPFCIERMDFTRAESNIQWIQTEESDWLN